MRLHEPPWYPRSRWIAIIPAMPRRPLLLAVSLLLPIACDQPSPEELQSKMEDVARSQVEALEAKHTELAEVVAARDGHAKRVEVLETQLAELSVQVVGVESSLAEARAQLDLMNKKAEEKAAPPVRPGRPDPANYYKVVVGDAQTRGPDTALVTVVTWSDFQCPYCKRVTPTIDEVRKHYGSDVRYVFKHNPLAFHPNAHAAAVAAEAAGEQGKFWEMHDKLFENAKDLTEKNFVRWAREIGMDIKRFKRDLDNTAVIERVDRQQREGVALGARGTPAFFVNGRFLSGAQPLSAFKALIDEEMKKAEAKVAAGTSRSSVYAETIATGRTEP